MKESSEEVVCKNCHPEPRPLPLGRALKSCNSGSNDKDSGSHPLLTMQEAEMLKRVQHDNTWGFTLIEILVVVLIIGILGAIALPQYQRAVLKSRYSGMMPIAKALAEANEVYYLEHGEYSENPADLLVAGRDKNAGAYPDGTRVLMYDEDGLSYVRVMNDNVPNARYIVYQKHSENFADTTQCEAADDRANELCQALGGTLIEEGNSSGETGWTAYLLSGRYGSGDSFAEVGTGGDEPGSNTEPEPQTPQCQEPSAEELAALQASARASSGNNKLTVTAQCINGKVKYEWTGGKVYAKDYDHLTTLCTGDSAYGCAGSEFKGEYNRCDAKQENGCAGSTFSGYGTRCLARTVNGCIGSTFSGYSSTCAGNAANACADSTFSGVDSYCDGNAANGCAGSTFSGVDSYCYGKAANGCAGTTIQVGSMCTPKVSDGCDGAKYGTDPTGQRTGIGVCYDYYGYCPNGSPITTNRTWNVTNGSYNIDSWKGGYCDPNAMVTGKCPAGAPKQGGGCWDGEGNQTSC